MIRPIGFLDLSAFTASYVLKYKAQLQNGVLELRGVDEADVLAPIVDRPILQEWKAAKNLLGRYRSHARGVFRNAALELGKAWIEVLPGGQAVPWQSFEDDYAQDHIRTRTCMVPAPDAYSLSGMHRELIGVGVVNVVEHRVLHSEVNFSTFPRVHLIVDVERPHADEIDPA